ncbi:MAG TPA: protease pro-enzyme activation domain-containing protein, partial [Xanthomonadaceae bacterium]|nr:protease pro-enzyme activation domain-containing protein [Xanthomonadaceae bacterium]
MKETNTGAFATVAHPTALRQGDAVIGVLPRTQPIHIVVGLKLRNHDALDAFVAANAQKQAQHLAPQLMTSDQFLANHAPTQVQAQTVANYLTNMGYRNVVIAPDRLLISADGTAATAESAFLTSFAQVRTHDGRTAFANTDDVLIPVALQDSILSVIGLQTVHQAHTFARIAPAAAHTNAIIGHYPTAFASIYGGAGVATASNVVVGILTEGSLTQTIQDLNTFTKDQALSTVTTQTVNTNGTSSDTAGTDEWDLDSQDIVGMAGGKVSKLIFYNIPSLADTDITADIGAIKVANQAKIISGSIGECETDAQGDGSAATDDTIFEAATAQGQTFVFSTGDSGAAECPPSTAPTPSWPAASQYVIAAAGTTLDASSTTWNSETVWSDSGGSPSTFEPMPIWQKSFGVPGTTRGVADVAFDGDPNSGSVVVVNGKLSQIGGTSLSAPLFAGQWARVIGVKGTGVGFAGPLIYNLQEADFHDITSGSNGGETAKVGYDFASGRGSIILNKAIEDVGAIPPVANFSFTSAGLTAFFTDKSTDSGSTIADHEWYFGDGTVSAAVNPSHFYAAAGTYSVKETVTNNHGEAVSKTTSVTVSNSGGTQLLGNTGFETGTATPWTITTGVLQKNSTLAHSGSWFAEIGNGGTGA